MISIWLKLDELSNLWDIGLVANTVFMGTVKFHIAIQFGENVFACWLGVSLKKGQAFIFPSRDGLSCIAVASVMMSFERKSDKSIIGFCSRILSSTGSCHKTLTSFLEG
jgi:hypothetical protein